MSFLFYFFEKAHPRQIQLSKFPFLVSFALGTEELRRDATPLFLPTSLEGGLF